jgi:hypothetical protein
LAGHRIVWADQAVVTEYVPSSRCTTSWLLRREYRRGNTLSLCVAWLEGSLLRRVKRVSRAVLVFCGGVMTMLMAPARGRPALLKGAQRVCFAAGLVTGMAGHIYEEYGRTHGS